MHLLIYLLVNIGFTLIVTQSKIIKSLRNFLLKINPNFLGYWIKCPMCFGFFSGLITSIFWYSPTYSINFPIFFPILDGFISSFVCYLIYLLIKPLMNKYD